MGCTTITYDAPLRKYLMCVTDGGPGVEDMNSYILEADEISGPCRLVTFMNKFGRQSEDPLKGENNVALRARVNVSSVHQKNKPFTELIEYFGEGAVDGIVDLDAEINAHEWVSRGERETAMIRLSWDSPQTVRRVWLFDRPDPGDHITAGVLLFSDGSAVRVGELPNDAKSCKELSFPPKTITWVIFAIDAVSEETANPGLAEMAVFRD
jgi:hypothetical protein